MEKKIRIQCESMTDDELIRALTVERENYTDIFTGVAGLELEKRGRTVSDYLNRVRVAVIGQKEKEVSIDEAVGLLGENHGMIRFSNSMDHVMVVRSGSLCWSVKGFSHEKESPPYHLSSPLGLEKMLKRFLHLENWEEGEEPGGWKVVAHGEKEDVDLGYVSSELADISIPSLICEGVSCSGRSCAGPVPELLVEEKHLQTGLGTLAGIRSTLESLYEAAEGFEEGADPEEEVAVYDRLSRMVTSDETVFFNRGVLLYDLGRFAAAAESFTVSAFNGNDEEIRTDSRDYLVDLLEKLPEEIFILHTLASIAMEEGNLSDIEKYYGKIVALSPSDTLAHLNLGYLYYANSGDNSLILDHFKAFLSLRPDSEEAVEVGRIVEELELNPL